MSSRLRVALLVVCGYMGTAFCVGTFYPFSVFDMYSHRTDNGSRIVARQGGQIEEVDRYVDWSCEGEMARCGSEGAIATSEPLERELIGWVRAHGGVAATPVDLVRRTWFFSSEKIRVDDCLLQHCKASRR